MKRISLVAALLIAGCGGGTAPVVTPVNTAPVVTVAAPTAVVFIGDSITAGWPFPPDANIINAGVSGEWSELMLARFDKDVMSHRPAVVAILAGTNDVRTYVDPPMRYIDTMADRAAASGACVIIGTVPPNTIWGVNSLVDAQTGPASILAFNLQLKALASAHGYELADYFPVLALPDGSLDAALFVDGIHPNDTGHAKMWDVVAPLIKKCKLRLGIP